MSNGRPPIGAPPRPATQTGPVREEVAPRTSQREEIPISRPPAREEIPLARPPVREEVPISRPPAREDPAAQMRVSTPTPAAAATSQPGATTLTPQMLQNLAQQIEARVRAQVEAQLETRHKQEPHNATQEALDALRTEVETLRARLAAEPAMVAAQIAAAAPAATKHEEPGPGARPALPTHAPGTPGKNRIDRFLKLMSDRGASDLHLSVGRPPIFRLGGRMEPIRYRTLDDVDYKNLLEPITPMHIWADFLDNGDADFAYELPGVCRFRVNRAAGLPIHLIGIEFSRDRRSVVGFEVEHI